MTLTPIEKEILSRISKNQLMTKVEVMKFLRSEKKVSNPKGVLDSSITNLLNNGFVDVVNPIGSTCIVITQEGSRYLDSF